MSSAAQPSPPPPSPPRWDASSPAGQLDTARAAQLLATRLPDRLEVFARLAYDLEWHWQAGGSDLFRDLDPHAWERCEENPVRLLLEASPAQLERAAADAALVERAEGMVARLEARRAEPFRQERGVGPTAPVAFLCAEFGAHPALRIYAGGLGLLAGDLLREASDAAFPMVGVGLLYRQGYFRQRLETSGWQHEYWIERQPELLPLARVSDGRGAPLQVAVEIRGRQVAFQLWRAQVGRTSLYLLDADLPENSRIDRWITARLYEGDREVRLAQYAALGIGGIRALRALGVEPAVVHLNEGHASLATLELLREQLSRGVPRQEALEAVRQRIVFTTHTPVAAGNEAYPLDRLDAVLGGLPKELGVDPKELHALGRVHPGDASEPFGLTPLALRASRRANGVSRIHGGVARAMWKELWPDRPETAVPITHVTNGAHLPTWMSPFMRQLLSRHLGEGFEDRAMEPSTWDRVEEIPDAELWEVLCRQRAALVEFARDRAVADRLARGESPAYVEGAARTFDVDVVTLGFARRLASYKRLHLIAREPMRALRLVRSERPIQLLIAGKAHPSDDEAKGVLQRMFGLRLQPPVGDRVAYLEDYDSSIAARLVAGCDVWVNLPRPPLEASGTSGIKAALNGALQLSVLDGWWAEAFDGTNGWALPADPAESEEARDARDAAMLYDLIENEIVPLFHDRDADGLPRGWLRRVKASLRSIGPRFCSRRMLEEYARRIYPEE